MKAMRKILTLTLISSFLFAQGQDTKSLEIGLSLFGMRQFKELPTSHSPGSNNLIAIPKGLVINSIGQNLRTSIELNYYNQKAELDGANCNDCGGGSGHLKGIETKVGVFKNYSFGKFIVSPGISAYFLRTNVRGTYYGGIDWSTWEVNSRTSHLGVNPTLSVSYDRFKPFIISMETGAFFGKLYGNDVDKRFSNEQFFSPVQSISLRYRIK